MTINHIITLFLLILVLGMSSCGSQAPGPANLKVETLTNPYGLDIKHPRFSWQIESEQSNILQNAYQILVAKSAEDLKNETNLVWNSGRVESGNSILIPFAGENLESEKTYYWKVKITTNKGESTWSEPATYTMAYINDALPLAKWIGIDNMLNSGKLTTKTRLSARYLRKEFNLEKEINKATLYISGLGMYECYINGEKISNDIFAPTATDYNKRVNYNVFEVNDYFTSNKNTIGVILGNGRFFSMRRENVPGGEPLDNPPQVHYGFPKLLLQLEIEYVDGGKETIVSDGSWKINTEGPIVANNEFDGEEYNANLELTNWNVNDYDDQNWRNAQLVDAPNGKLVAQLNPNITTMKEVKPVDVKPIEEGRYVVDMGQNMVGWLAVNLKGSKDRPVILRYAELVQEDGNIYTANLRGAKSTDTYIPANDQVFNYEPRFVYHGFRYVEITGIDYVPDLNDLKGKVIYDYMDSAGSFGTSDSTINQIYKNAYWGIIGNYRSMPTDCPQRDERMGWLGDRAIGCFGESFMLDNQLLYAKWVQDIQDTQLESGSISDVAPAYWQFYSDNITWPGTYVFVTQMLYEQFGDTRPIKLHYKTMKKWMDYMESRYMKDYIMTKDQYGDWCMPPESLHLIHSKDPDKITDGEILSTTFYYRLLNVMSQFAEIVGNKSDKEDFLSLAAKVKTSYNNKFFQPQNAQYGNNTTTANLISLMQGLVPSGYEKKVFENLTARIEGEFDSHVSVGLIGIQFLMRGLTEYGRPDLAYKIATNRTYPSWGYMIENGATTIWELWNGNTADPSMNSANHVMLLGDFLVWCYEDLGGIKTDSREVAFKKILMNPVFPEGLNFVKASHESPYGMIKSEWKKENNNLIWNVVVPPNTTAEVTFPANSATQVSNNGSPLENLVNVEILQKENSMVSAIIPSGNYSFKIENANYNYK